MLIWLGERLFLVYAANLANFNALYGALGGIVAFLLWLISRAAWAYSASVFAQRRWSFGGEPTIILKNTPSDDV